jgi:hypothetical protein
MSEDLEQLKQRLPLLEYLRRHNWTGHHVGAGDEFVGLCPLHPDKQPSFYINARKNLFYCHGCNCGGDLIRFVELSERLSFRESIAHLKHEIYFAAESELLDRTAAFYQVQLQRHSEAAEYLQKRGLRDPDLIIELGLGYAPGGNLRRHLTAYGYSIGHGNHKLQCSFSGQGFTFTLMPDNTGVDIDSVLTSPGTHTLIQIPDSQASGTYSIKANATTVNTDSTILASYYASSTVQQR